jgi:outer membrane protein assembly factor BamA/autotransporter translocation and assembly factor TamB
VKLRRRRLLVLAGVTGAMVACFAAGLFPQGPLRRFAESRLQSAWGPAARIGRLTVVPARLRLEVDDLSLGDSAFALTVPRLRGVLDPSVLLGGGLVLRHLEVDGAHLTLHASKGTAASAAALPVAITRMDVTRGAVTYVDPAGGGSVALRGVEIHGGLGTGALDLAAAAGSWTGPHPAAFGPIRARVAVSPLLAIDVAAFEAHMGPSWVRAHGALGRVGAWSPSLEVEASADLAALSRELQLPASLGVVSASGHVGGSPSALRAEASFDTRSAQVAGWPLDRLSATLAYDEEGADHTTAQLVGTLLGGKVDGKARLVGRALDARLSLDDVDLARLGQAAHTASIGGSASVEVSLRGDVSGSLEAEARWSAASDMTPLPGSLRGSAKGLVRPGNHTVDLEWNAIVQGAATAPSSSRPRLADLEASIEGSAHGRWPPDVQGSGELNLGLETATGHEELPLRATFRSLAGALAITLDGEPLSGTLHADAQLHGSSVDRLAVEADGLDVHRLDPAWRGRATFRLSGSGASRRFSGKGRAAIDDLGVGPLAVGPVTLDLDSEAGATSWTLGVPALRVAGSGTLRPTPTPVVHGSVTLDDTPLAPFGPLAGEGPPLEGVVAATADLEIPVAEVAEARAEASVSRVTASRGPYSLETQPFRVRWADGRVWLSSFSVHGSGASVTAEGAFGLGQKDPVDLKLGLEVDLSGVPAPEGLALGGRVTAKGSLSGTSGAPRATGVVEVRELSVDGATIPKIAVPEGRIELAGDAFHIAPLTILSGDATATLSGTLPFAALGALASPGCEDASLRAEWSNVQVADLLTGLVSQEGAGVRAALSGHAQATGCPRAPATLEGSLDIDEGQLHFGELAVNLSPVNVKLDKGRVSTQGITLWTEQGTLQTFGSIDLAKKEVDGRLDGRLELRALSPLVGAAAFAGTADVSVSLRGPMAAPRAEGQIWVRDAAVRLRDIPNALTSLNGSIILEGDVLRILETKAALGGGEVTVSGEARTTGTTLTSVNVRLKGEDLTLRYPAGLRSRLDADISLTGAPGAFVLGGEVHVQRGLYDLDTALGASSAPAAATTPSPLLRSVALNTRVSLDGPVLIRNNLASLDVTGNLTFRGDMEAPSPLGRLDIRRGGHVYIQTRNFSVENGGLLYDGNWNPTVSLRATADIRDSYDSKDRTVQLVADGPLETVQPTLHAPPLSDAQALSLVATGNSSNAALAAGARVAGGQAANVLVGRVSQSLGLDEVTVQPELLARETDPGTRFTFGKHLTSAVSLIYSVGLGGPEQRFLQLEGRPTRSVSLKVQRSDDGLLTYGAGQSLRFGQPRQSRRSHARRPPLSEVRLEGDTPLPEEQLRGALESRAGKRATTWTIQEDADRLRQRLVDERYLEAEVAGRIEGDAAVFRIHAGPRFAWRVEGMVGPPDLGPEMRKALFEEDALDRGTTLLLRKMRSQGYLHAAVTARGIDEAGGRTLVFEATPGEVLTVDVLFPGAHALPTGDLLEAAGGAGEVLTEPAKAVEGIRAAYRARHFLVARAGPVEIEESGGHLIATVPIEEGPPAKLASVSFEGANALSEAALRESAGLPPGALFVPAAPPAAAERLRRRYFSLGFPNVRVAVDVAQQGADVALLFRIHEGDQVFVRHVTITGLGRTRESVVRRRIAIRPGDPLDPQRLAAAERGILGLGIFSRATVTASETDPGEILVALEEEPRLVASYDLRYNNEDKATAQLDGEVRNVLGLGLIPGARYRVGADVREVRGSLVFPSPFGRGSFTGTVFHQQEDLELFDPLSGETLTNVQTERGFQIQHTTPFRNRWNLLTGYRYKRASSTFFPDPLAAAGIDVSLARETRDNPLDAHRGRFWGFNLTWSPTVLASDFSYLKGFAQVSIVRPLGERWLWAHGYRLGLAVGLSGQQVDPSERFKAGGANSMRGYSTDGVGPIDISGQPAGGEAVLVVNEELRYMSERKVGAAFFYDGGNVFEKVSDMGFDLRHTLGLGLRWESPVGLLRLDFGIPLNRDPLFHPETGERVDKPYRIFLSLGQAF